MVAVAAVAYCGGSACLRGEREKGSGRHSARAITIPALVALIACGWQALLVLVRSSSNLQPCHRRCGLCQAWARARLSGRHILPRCNVASHSCSEVLLSLCELPASAGLRLHMRREVR